MDHKKNTNKERMARHARVRKKISGTAERPRLNVFRSLTNIYAQIVDDSRGITLVSASSLEKPVREKGAGTGNRTAAREVGKLVGARAVEKGISQVVFDRSGYIYHGRIQEVADGARESGLKF